MVTLKLASILPVFLKCPSTETRNGVTDVPISAPMIAATANDRGNTPEEVNATTIESKAPLLWSSAVPIQPANTALVVCPVLIIRFSRQEPRLEYRQKLSSSIFPKRRNKGRRQNLQYFSRKYSNVSTSMLLYR